MWLARASFRACSETARRKPSKKELTILIQQAASGKEVLNIVRTHRLDAIHAVTSLWRLSKLEETSSAEVEEMVALVSKHLDRPEMSARGLSNTLVALAYMNVLPDSARWVCLSCGDSPLVVFLVLSHSKHQQGVFVGRLLKIWWFPFNPPKVGCFCWGTPQHGCGLPRGFPVKPTKRRVHLQVVGRIRAAAPGRDGGGQFAGRSQRGLGRRASQVPWATSADAAGGVAARRRLHDAGALQSGVGLCHCAAQRHSCRGSAGKKTTGRTLRGLCESGGAEAGRRQSAGDVKHGLGLCQGKHRGARVVGSDRACRRAQAGRRQHPEPLQPCLGLCQPWL